MTIDIAYPNNGEYFLHFSQTIESDEDIIESTQSKRTSGGLFIRDGFKSIAGTGRAFKLIHQALSRSDIDYLFNHYEYFKEHEFLVYIKTLGAYVNCIYTKPPKVSLTNNELGKAEVELVEALS